MAAFFGVNGVLFEVKCPASADRVSSRPVSFTRTLGGKVKGFSGRASRRSWSLDVAAGTPKDVSVVEALARASTPLVFISPEAAIGNLLSPQASMFEPLPANAVDGGLVSLPDGTVARAVTHGAVMAVGTAHGGHELVPVNPGEAVSLGVWARNGARLSGWWRDLNGATLTSFASVTSSFSGWAWRQATFAPPAGAAYLSMHVSAGSMYARPTVSWGNVAQDEAGTGCPKSILHEAGFSPIVANRSLNLSRMTYSVTEVG